MVVLVNLVAALLAYDVLVRVILVIGIDVPALNELRDILTLGEVPFALEVTILQQVLLDVSILCAPIRLQREVGYTEGIDRHPIAIDEHAAVCRYCIAIGVVLSVGVIERTSVSGIRYTLLADEYILGVQHAHAGVLDIALESESPSGYSIGQDLFAGFVGLRFDFNGITFLCQVAGIERMAVAISGSLIDGILRKVLLGQWRTITNNVHVRAYVARAQDEFTCIVIFRGQVRNRNLHLLGSCLDVFRCYTKTICHTYLNVFSQSCGNHRNSCRLVCLPESNLFGQRGTGFAYRRASLINESDGHRLLGIN